TLRRGAEAKDKLIASLNYHLIALQRTIGWKVLERLRRLRDRLLPVDSRRRDLYWRIRRPVEVLLDEGLRAFIRKTRYKLRLKWRGQEVLIKGPPPGAPRDLAHQYQLWIEQHRMRPHDVAAMKAAATSFRHTPVVSLVTCIHDTDESRLRGLIECVRDQIYPHWELCVVNDGSTKPHVRALLDEYI